MSNFVCCTFQSFSISYRIFLLFCAIEESLYLLNEVYEKKICVGPHVDLGTITWILAFLMSKHLFHFLYLQMFILCCHTGVEFELQTIWNRNFSDWVLILILSRSSNLNWRNNFEEKNLVTDSTSLRSFELQSTFLKIEKSHRHVKMMYQTTVDIRYKSLIFFHEIEICKNKVYYKFIHNRNRKFQWKTKVFWMRGKQSAKTWRLNFSTFGNQQHGSSRVWGHL